MPKLNSRLLRITVLMFAISLILFFWTIPSLNRQSFGVNGMEKFKGSLLSVPKNLILSLLSKNKFEDLYIEIPSKSLKKLTVKRNQALKEGVLFKSKNDYVSARVSNGNTSAKVKLRLKGDWTDHLTGKKWSFRVNVKGKKSIYSMKRFSIQHPKTRGFQGELLFHQLIKEFNIITPKYFFSNVYLNGDYLGIMAIEEHFTKELLERNHREEGVIVKYDESYLFKATDGTRKGMNGFYDDFRSSFIDSFQSGRIKKSKVLSKQFEIAVGLLRGFDEGSLKASEVFDVPQTSNYIAISEFIGAYHALRWHNMRFYLNPNSLKLEPIAFDASLQLRKEPEKSSLEDSFIKTIFRDSTFNKSIDTALTQIKIKAQNGDIEKRFRSVESEVLPSLKREYYLLNEFNYSEIKERIEKLLNKKPPEPPILKLPTVPDFPVLANAFLVENDGIKTIQIYNLVPFKLKIDDIFLEKDGELNSISDTSLNLSLPISLKPSTKHQSKPKVDIIFKEKIDNLDKIYIQVDLVDENRTDEILVKNYFPFLRKLPLTASGQ